MRLGEYESTIKANYLLTWTYYRAKIVCWMSEAKRLFSIVKDRGFVSLMKTGRPSYWLLSPSTVSHDVKKVFARVRQRIAKMLRVSDWVGTFQMKQTYSDIGPPWQVKLCYRCVDFTKSLHLRSYNSPSGTRGAVTFVSAWSCWSCDLAQWCCLGMWVHLHVERVWHCGEDA